MDLAIEEKKKKTKNCKIEDDQAKGGIESLPRDLALDILSRLPVTSLIQFRFTARSCNSLSYDPILVPLHFSRTAVKNPYLIFHRDSPLTNQLSFVKMSDHPENEIARKAETPFHNLMPEFNVAASCDGLLCLYDSLYSEPVIVYNPFTGRYKELPRTRQYDDQEVLFGFGFSAASKEFKVVKIVYYWNHYGYPDRFPGRRIRNRRPSGSEVQVCSLSVIAWRNLGSALYKLEHRPSEALVNGRLHWLTTPRTYCDGNRSSHFRNIVSFDLGGEKFEEVPRPDCGGLNMLNYHLGVVGGCLCAMVYVYRERYEIWVMREYGIKESWAKEFVIGDYSRQFIRKDLRRLYRLRRNVAKQRDARFLCVLENGHVLIEYKCGVLVSHDPSSGAFKKIVFKGMPDLFQTVLHVGSLAWIDAPVARITN